jgi:ADP-heptose:LPS heptosyltransferase
MGFVRFEKFVCAVAKNYFCHLFCQILNKILVIRFSSIGDIVLTTPVLRCIKKQLDDVVLHVVTRAAHQKMLENNPYIDKVFGFKTDLDEVVPALKAQQYDHIVDLHKNLRSFLLIHKLKRPSTSFPKFNLKKYLFVRFKLDLMPKLHIVDRYFEAVKKLGVQNDQQGLDYFIPVDQQIAKTKLPPAYRQGYIAVVIGGKHLTKVLPAHKVIEVLAQLNLPSVLLGGPEDKERGDSIVAALNERVWNTCGEFSLDQSASLIQHSKAVLTNDTGLMHIAAALQKPILSVWGNTVPSFGMYPYMPQKMGQSVIVENNALSCRPCSKIGFDHCPKGHFKCMNELDAAIMATKLNQISQLQQKDC